MIPILAIGLLGQQSVDKAWIRSMQELLRLNPAACATINLKDTLGERTVFLDEKGKVLRTDAGAVQVKINSELNVLSTIKNVDGKIKLFLIDLSGVRFQTEFEKYPYTTWIGKELFAYGEQMPTARIAQTDSAPWTVEKWPNLKTYDLVAGVEPGTYFATIDWPDHKDAYTKIVTVSADGTTSKPAKYDSTRQMKMLCQPGQTKLMFENESGEFVIGAPSSGSVQKYPSDSYGERAWLSDSKTVAFIRKAVGNEHCHTQFSLFQPKNNQIENVDSPGKAILKFVALGSSAILVQSGREYFSCFGGGQQGGTYVPKKEPITDEKPSSDLYWFDPKTGKSKKLAEFIPSASVYLNECRFGSN